MITTLNSVSEPKIISIVKVRGRARTLEIVISSDDFDADIGERYGFLKRPLEMGKSLVNARAGVPARSELYTSAYFTQAGKNNFWFKIKNF